ncbi:MAG: hypothetical protein ACREQ7_07440 [Candidatus Binatia bacterium]
MLEITGDVRQEPFIFRMVYGENTVQVCCADKKADDGKVIPNY